MHNAAFAAAGIDGRYELMEIDEADVARAVDAAHGPDLPGPGRDGTVQTAPASLVDEVEPDATAIGAVNNEQYQKKKKKKKKKKIFFF